MPIRSGIAQRALADRVHDLTTAFDASESWFVDAVHFEGHGRQMIADAMAPRVLAALGDDLRPAGTTRCAR